MIQSELLQAPREVVVALVHATCPLLFHAKPTRVLQHRHGFEHPVMPRFGNIDVFHGVLQRGDASAQRRGGFLRPESDGVHEIRECCRPRPLLRVHYSRHDQSGDPLLAVHPVHVVHGNDGLERLGAIRALPGVHSEPHVEVEGIRVG